MVATAADGDVDTRRLADISTPSAKPLTTSLPPSTGEQTHPLRRKQTLGAYECLRRESAMLGGRLKGPRAAGLYETPCVFFSISVNLSDDWGKQLPCILCLKLLIASKGRRKLLVQAVMWENRGDR